MLLLFASVCCAQNTTGVPSTTVKPDDSKTEHVKPLYILAGVSGGLLFLLTIMCLCFRRRERRARAVRDVIPASYQFANPVFSDPTLPACESPYGPASPIYPYLSCGVPYPHVVETGLYPRYESDSSEG